MNYSFLDFLTLVGSLGIFLYGMKIMSEGLQKVAGDKLRSILSGMTSSRVTGVLTGLFITSVIQSSSATTVMVVSFVNAGLLTLAQSISVIMGANIGTTATAWLVTLGGLGKFSLSAISIPLAGLSLPFIFSSRSNMRAWGEFIIGFAFLFFGLGVLGSSVPDIKSNPEMLEFLNRFTDMGFGSVLLFLLFGTILTLIVQSSSATMAITLIMIGNGWIGFEMAAAMVMGENIGTTITANLAALSANLSAKRAAFAHFMFNVMGVCWLLLLFYPFVNLIQYLSGVFEFESLASSLGMESPTQLQLSLFHSVFNIINTFVMIWFVNLYVKVVTRVIKTKKTDEEEFQLTYIQGGLLSTDELSLLQAEKEISIYIERTRKMFRLVRELTQAKPNSQEYLKLYSRIEKYEVVSDRMEIEIAEYLSKVADGELSSAGKAKLRVMLNRITEIESINDSCFHIARTIQRRIELKCDEFNETITEGINSMYALVDKALENLAEVMKKSDINDTDKEKTLQIELEINNYRNLLREKNVGNVKNKVYSYQSAIHYMDIILECERLGDYIVNVVEANADKLFESLEL